MQHIPVLLREVIAYLQPERGGLFVDCTVGLGGHAEAILERAPGARVLGVDRDPQALELARERLERFGSRVRLVEADFADLPRVVEAAAGRAAGVLADLGVSSLQLDTAERGFSFRWNGPLDMRMGIEGPTAAEVVNKYSEEALRSILWEHGQERQARRIAKALIAARSESPLETTDDLKRVVYRAKGKPAGRRGRREGRVDPATRVFQALRIEVNRELVRLQRLLDVVVQLIEADGRLVVISYHSLEDRVVKNSLRNLARGKIDEITGRPHSETKVIEVLTKKPVRPSVEEVEVNPRARSARLRAARRL